MMNKILTLSVVALTLCACTGTQLGLGVGTGSPGVGVGAGLSFPVGQRNAPNDEDYARNIIEEIYARAGDTRPWAGKLCTLRIAADVDGTVLDVARVGGDENWCERVMMAATSLHTLPPPPAALVDRLQQGLIVDLIPR